LTSTRETLESSLADRYVIERELGRGGMATVYLARDLKHDRPVALKVLHPELGQALGPERFQREIRLAARLQHPHILTMLDSGAASLGSPAQALWFTMPFVDGESLRTRLQRERQLPVDDALRIAREAAQALQYAHDQGVIHRDIKPENLLLTRDGNTLVADFGIARALGAGADQARLTETGLVVGTPAYMSPEQASGDKSLDARTDIYSLSAVLYEMLSGEPPYTGATTQAVIVKRLTEPAPSVRSSRPSVPEAVDQAIRKALAPMPADRYSTIAQFAQVLYTGSGGTPAPAPTSAATLVTAPATPPLDRLAPPSTRRPIPLAAAALIVGVLIGLGVLFAWRHSASSGAGAPSGTKVLAVLPFENLGDATDAYFADGVTDEVRTRLAKINGLQVIARGSSNEYRHTTKRPQEVARELGVDFLLTATVRWEKVAGGASRVRVSPELVDVSPGHAPRTRWGEQFDASLTDVFQVQADIAGKVASALDVALGESTRHELATKPTENLAAYDAFLKGEAASQSMSVGDPGSLRRAADLYSQAVALDSAFVPAWAQLARAQSLLYFNSTPTPAQAEAARHAVERARALGPNRPEGYLALGDYHSNVTIDNPRSLAAYEAGLKLAPNDVDLLVQGALTEEGLGRWELALSHLAKASALDPRSANTARRYAYALLNLRRYPEAERAFDRALALAPTNISIIEQKAIVRLAQGDLSGAQTVLRDGLARVDTTALLAFFGNYQDLYWVLDDALQRRLLALSPSAFDNDRGTWSIVLAQTYHLRKDLAKAKQYADSARLSLQEVLRSTPQDGQRHVILGLALAYLGQKAEAIREGERAVQLVPLSRDAYLGAYIQHQLVRIYLLTGEPEKALDQLEPLLKMPYLLTPGWLKIDPTFDPLRRNPRFEKMVKGDR
jgi:serine/threonine protein kinase/tetratricopeptide (TPR) repeat protein